MIFIPLLSFFAKSSYFFFFAIFTTPIIGGRGV